MLAIQQPGATSASPTTRTSTERQRPPSGRFPALYGRRRAPAQSTQQYIGDSGVATLVSSESYPALHSVYVAATAQAFKDAYDDVDTSTARDLREIAKVHLRRREQGVPNVNARFFQLSNGGYDTHSDQGGADPDGQHYGLHKEVGDALKVFYDDLADMGVGEQGVRRRVERVRAPHHAERQRHRPRLAGADVRGRRLAWTAASTATTRTSSHGLDDDGNTVYTQAAGTHRSTDFRDVYGTVLKHWLNMTQATILASVLAGRRRQTRANYWNSANFDLGFLPDDGP